MNISQDCIEGCKKGDQAFQKMLYDASLPYLNVVCRRYLFDDSYRQDILQEAYVKIFTNIHQYDSDKGTFKTWASKIIFNLCLRENNKKKFTFFRPPEKVPEQLISPEIIEGLECGEIIDLLKLMPVKYYEVFNLFVIDGYNHEEIAKLLNINVNLSKKRLSRARAWLKKNPTDFKEYLGEFRISID